MCKFYTNCLNRLVSIIIILKIACHIPTVIYATNYEFFNFKAVTMHDYGNSEKNSRYVTRQIAMNINCGR